MARLRRYTACQHSVLAHFVEEFETRIGAIPPKLIVQG